MIPPPLLHALRAYVRYVPGHLGKPWLAARLSDHLKHHPLTATARTRNSAVFPVLTSDVIHVRQGPFPVPTLRRLPSA